MRLEAFWRVVGSPAGRGRRLAEWQGYLGDEFERVVRFLRPTDSLAQSYPCPHPGGEGCPREVIHHSADHIVAACRDVPPSCELLRLERSDLILYEIDLKSVLRQVGQALNLRLALKREGHALWYLGTIANAGTSSIEALVALSQESGEFEALISGLLLDRSRGFLLLVPCLSQLSSPTLDRCHHHEVEVVGLTDLMVLGESGDLEQDPAFDLPALGIGAVRTLPNTFRRDGDYWTVVFDGKTVLPKDSLGLLYLRKLLRAPKTDILCTDLLAEAVKVGNLLPLGRGIEKQDEEGLSALKERAKSAQAELAEAKEFGNSGRVDTLTEELESIYEECATAVGLGGKGRSAGSSINRIRDSVGQAIRRAIKQFEESHGELHLHLKGTVELGRILRYSPPVLISWITE